MREHDWVDDSAPREVVGRLIVSYVGERCRRCDTKRGPIPQYDIAVARIIHRPGQPKILAVTLGPLIVSVLIAPVDDVPV